MTPIENAQRARDAAHQMIRQRNRDVLTAIANGWDALAREVPVKVQQYERG
jgi:hypothetical protein